VVADKKSKTPAIGRYLNPIFEGEYERYRGQQLYWRLVYDGNPAPTRRLLECECLSDKINYLKIKEIDVKRGERSLNDHIP
jgi:hypothetical protein